MFSIFPISCDDLLHLEDQVVSLKTICAVRGILKSYAMDLKQVALHNTAADCWVAVHGKVYNVTEFLSSHPGGKKVLLRAAGTDATALFDKFHSLSVLDQHKSLCIGSLASGKVESSVSASIIPYADPNWAQKWTSPYYTDSHFAVRAAVRDFVSKRISPFCSEWDSAKELPLSLFKESAAIGFLSLLVGPPWPLKHVPGMPVPGGVDPAKLDHFHELIAIDELARCGSGGVLWGLMAGIHIGLPPVLHFGSEALKKKVVGPCLRGEKVICLAITEPYAGSDVASIQCEAVRDGDYYIVSGEKKWITNGTYASFMTVAVRTGGPGMGGISLLLLERDMPGITTRHLDCQGVWASGTSYITFEDVRVPVANLIGEEGQGFKYIMKNFNHERWGIVVQTARFSRVCYEDAFVYAHKRKTFGKRLVDHPVIRNKLAHMLRQIEATQAWLEQVTHQMNSPGDSSALLAGPIALLKAQSTQTFEYCAREAMQIFGGLGYTRNGQGERVERLYREVRGFAIPGGSEEIMLDFGVRQAVKHAKL